MDHQFKVEIAKKLDVPCAIFLQHIAFWILKNQANGKNFREGHYWTYNSISAFGKLFPYYSEPQIKRIIKRLEDKNIIESQVLNAKGYDRTKWYRIIDNEIVRIYSIHSTNSSNGLFESVQPIPDSKPSNKPIDTSWYVEYINEVMKRKFKSFSNSLKSKLRDRLKTFSKEEIKRAILKASKDSYHQDNDYRYLTPEYFVRSDEMIDKWLNAPEVKEQSNNNESSMSLEEELKRAGK